MDIRTRGKLTILRGLPASGKSTFAKTWVEEHPSNRVIVCRDSIRRSLGPYWIPTREKLVTEIEELMVLNAMFNINDEDYCFDIVLDATNFKGLDKWKEFAEFYSYEFEIKDFTDVPLEECIKRDELREHKVGQKVIEGFYNKYLNK